MICGGTGCKIHPDTHTHSLVYRELSRRNENPAEACRPFDKTRDGEVDGEGAAAFVLERSDFAAARGAQPIARVLGVGSACGFHQPGRPYQASGLQSAITAALRDAAITSSQIGLIKAHGLATRFDDPAEAAVLRQLFSGTPVTALKGYFGNLGAGGGAVEMAAVVLALQKGVIPPTLNHREPDPACDLPLVTKPSCPLPQKPAIAVTFNPAGQAAAIVLGPA